MNIFLLGNGFDLHHNLPTTYSCFLHTVEFLKDAKIDNLDTIGKVFENVSNWQIKKSYDQYKEVYDGIALDISKMDFLAKKAKSNVWFSYLLKSLNKDLGWIDFEKEIARVVSMLNTFIGDIKRVDNVHIKNQPMDYAHIIQLFNSYTEERYREFGKNVCLKDDFVLEEPFGSGNRIVDKNKISNDLFESLQELSEMLKIYLECFVETTIDKLVYNNYIISGNLFNKADIIITFNYTNTFEKIYSDSNVLHLHGDVDNKIVLGINPDKYDEVGDIDCTFSMFKKYFQRLIFKTDSSYRRKISWIRDNRIQYYRLSVFGHSLDKTDEDIIEELFELASEIVIYYHDLNSYTNLVKNLISIYGKSRFDTLRREKNLEFLQISE